MDYVDDVILFIEILEIVLLSLDIIHHESRSFGLEVNWNVAQIQHTNMAASLATPINPTVMENDVEVVDKFAYMGCHLDVSGVR